MVRCHMQVPMVPVCIALPPALLMLPAHVLSCLHLRVALTRQLSRSRVIGITAQLLKECHVQLLN